MFTETTENIDFHPRNGWLFYDGQCDMCLAFVHRLEPILKARNMGLAPLQTPWVQKRIGLEPEQLLTEMRVLTPDGRIIGGANALLYLAKQIWWARPVYYAALLPGMGWLLGFVYRRIAAKRRCVTYSTAKALLLDLFARFTVALVWVYQGLWCKLLEHNAEHAAVVNAVPGLSSGTARLLLTTIGVVEVMLAGWVLSGRKLRLAAITQTALLIAMNFCGLIWARGIMHDPASMVIQNLALISLFWLIPEHGGDIHACH